MFFFDILIINMSVYPSDKLFKLLRSIIIVLIAAIVIGTVAAFVKKTRDRASGRQEEESDAGSAYIAIWGNCVPLQPIIRRLPLF